LEAEWPVASFELGGEVGFVLKKRVAASGCGIGFVPSLFVAAAEAAKEKAGVLIFSLAA
jgi:hypothetical protein